MCAHMIRVPRVPSFDGWSVIVSPDSSGAAWRGAAWRIVSWRTVSIKRSNTPSGKERECNTLDCATKLIAQLVYPK